MSSFHPDYPLNSQNTHLFKYSSFPGPVVQTHLLAVLNGSVPRLFLSFWKIMLSTYTLKHFPSHSQKHDL